jgi:hypothetical protein
MGPARGLFMCIGQTGRGPSRRQLNVTYGDFTCSGYVDQGAIAPDASKVNVVAKSARIEGKKMEGKPRLTQAEYTETREERDRFRTSRRVSWNDRVK